MQTDLLATGVSASHPSGSSLQDLPDADPVASYDKPTLLDLGASRPREAAGEYTLR